MINLFEWENPEEKERILTACKLLKDFINKTFGAHPEIGILEVKLDFYGGSVEILDTHDATTVIDLNAETVVRKYQVIK